MIIRTIWAAEGRSLRKSGLFRFKNYIKLLFACFALLIAIFLGSGNLTIDVQAKTAQAANIHSVGFIDNALSYSGGTKKLLKKLVQSSKAIEHLNQGQIRSLFFEPSLVRSDGKYSIWQYQNEYCVLDLYFNKTESDTVIYFETRKKSIAYSPHKLVDELVDIDKKRCISQFLI